MKTPRVFQIGFNRCGTRTLFHFFQRNGVPSCHLDRGRLARRMQRNLYAGDLLARGYPGVVFFADMEFVAYRQKRNPTVIEAYKWFPTLFHQYPGSRFILNTRGIDGWLRSRERLIDGLYIDAYRRYYRCRSRAAVLNRWRREYRQHHRCVQNFFAQQTASDRLLVFDIEKDNPEKICKFFQDLWPLSLRHYGHYHKTKT